MLKALGEPKIGFDVSACDKTAGCVANRRQDLRQGEGCVWNCIEEVVSTIDLGRIPACHQCCMGMQLLIALTECILKPNALCKQTRQHRRGLSMVSTWPRPIRSQPVDGDHDDIGCGLGHTEGKKPKA